ncbi:MAG: carbohydrate-binding protein [Spirochaetales bacterium]|nr:carbohydrate-binding protein [Spirochaetales bacterium]
MQKKWKFLFTGLLFFLCLWTAFADTISLRALANNQYVCAEDGGASALVANRVAVGGWEQFDRITNSDGTISLVSQANNLYVCADNAGASALIANRTAIGTWEKFRLITNSDGTVSLLALANNQYVCADDAGASPLVANRTAVGTWEKFVIIGDAGPAPTPTAPYINTSTPTPTATNANTSTPTPTSVTDGFSIPGRIEAEDYFAMSGIQTENTTDTGGGINVGWIDAGDWMEYPVHVTTGGVYSIGYRVAALSSSGTLNFLFDGVDMGPATIPVTGGWQSWTTVQGPVVTLSPGNHTVRLSAATNGFNINWFELYPHTIINTPTPVNTPIVTGTPAPTPTGPYTAPDFGPNVHIFSPSMSMSSIQNTINSVYNAQQNSQFGSRRDALVFMPGTYPVDIGVGFYTEVIGLGSSPDAVSITGNLHSDAYLSGNNATCNFWRGVSNFSVIPSNGTVKWAVSQAIWFRQMHIRGNVVLHQNGGWASGGWMANCRVDGNVDSGSQQQWITRNTQWNSWTGSNWNMVFVGVVDAPSGNFPNPPYTKVARAPILREKPFLQVDSSGNYSVRVPSLKTNSSGYDWASGSVPGTTLPISDFYVARAGVDSDATINAQLSAGKNLILTPGIYRLNNTIRITRANTIVLGMGFATLLPNTGAATMMIAEVDGVTLSGVLFDAGSSNSPVQLEVGTNPGISHAANPIALHDVIFRVGGATVGKTTVSCRINASDTIIDHTWIWRADHGSGVGWNSNTAANGIVVNGNNVTAYGLFVEHYQQYQALWNGNGGRVYFYQSEDPYDPPNQSSWTSGPGVNGWASYKVANSVTTHEAWGLGVYSVFHASGVNQTRAIETPVNSNVRFHSMVIKDLSQGHISYVINNTGNPTVTNFP